MTAELVVAIFGVLTTGGVGKLVAMWLDRRAKDKRDHELAMADRFAAMQKAFFDREKEYAAELRNERAERFADVRKYTETITDMGNKLADAFERLDSRRPPAGE